MSSVVRWLLSLTLVGLGVACGGGSGNNNGDAGNNTPSLSISPPSTTVIAGGSPVNFTATFANATGTATWSLTGPGSMSVDPSNGNSASYTPPASVVSPTSATLTATSGSLTASATITVNPPPTITVAGKVTDLQKKGLSGATVAIGAQHATTDGTGAFSIAGVTAPYDATVIVAVGSRNVAIVYKGLTRADPTLRAIPVAGSPPSSGTVSGSVSGGDALPAGSDSTAVAWGSPETAASSVFTNNPWSMTLHWGATPAATTGNVHALQWTPASGDIPTAYRGYGVHTGVTVGNGTTTSSVAVAMSTPASSTIAGSVTVPAGLTLAGKTLVIDFADGASFGVGAESTAATSFTYPVPTGIDSTASVIAVGSMTGAIVGTLVRGIAAGSSGTTVAVPSPALHSSPVANATGVNTGTDFSWSQLAGGLQIVAIIPTGSATAPAYYLVTTGSTGRIPDLSALGVVLPAGSTYGWAIEAVSPWASVDEFAGGAGTGLLPTGTNTWSLSITTAPRAFTTQ
jgi:hypothetical protein